MVTTHRQAEWHRGFLPKDLLGKSTGFFSKWPTCLYLAARSSSAPHPTGMLNVVYKPQVLAAAVEKGEGCSAVKIYIGCFQKRRAQVLSSSSRQSYFSNVNTSVQKGGSPKGARMHQACRSGHPAEQGSRRRQRRPGGSMTAPCQ